MASLYMNAASHKPWSFRNAQTLALSGGNLCGRQKFWRWQSNRPICASTNGVPFPRAGERNQKKKKASVKEEVQNKGAILEDGSSTSFGVDDVDDTGYGVEDVRDSYLDDDDDDDDDQNEGVEELCGVPFCPVPEFSTSSSSMSLLSPCNTSSSCLLRPLLIYVPGMDCTGQGIIKQLHYLLDAGYDVRCIYIPTTDRSSWAELIQNLIPMLRQAQMSDGQGCHMTLLAESFGGPLALRLAKAAPDIISRLVLVNSATNFQWSNSFASFWSSTRLLASFPAPLYKTAQDILLPLMVNRDRVKLSDPSDIFSPVDFVPAPCAAWRLSLLNDNSGLSDTDISSIKIPALLLSSSEDHILGSVEEAGRLNRLLPNSKRIILPGSGHTALLEDAINLPIIMEMHGFSATNMAQVGLPSDINLNASQVEDLGNTAMQDELLDEMGRFLGLWRLLTSPLVSGEENLPSPELKRPILFVGNHTMFGYYDTPLLFHELFLRGFRCRGLAHPGHWRTFVGPLFERYGHVKATKMAAYRLLKDKEHVLLFPGGAREVCKKKNEEYKLLWKPTADFVRMATRFKAIIVPFGSLGGDDAYKILFDADDILKSPLGPLWKDMHTRNGVSLDNISPITALPVTNLPSLLAIPNNIQRIYFHFAEPVDTTLFKGSENGDKYNEMYSLVRQRVENSINELKAIRLNDKEKELHKRVFGKVLDLIPEFTRAQA